MNHSPIATAEQWRATPRRRTPEEAAVSGALMCPPDHFDVIDIRNAHMSAHIGKIDAVAARCQWDSLTAAIGAMGLEVHRLDPPEGLVDAVFTANPSLVSVDATGQPVAVIGKMDHPDRRPESELHRSRWLQLGIRCLDIDANTAGAWEGNGDTLKHPGLSLLWCGVGMRSQLDCHLAVGRMLGHEVATLDLQDPCFYHLDTALAMLRQDCAAVVRSAFDETGIDLLESAFDLLVEVDENEAREKLAGNLWCPDGHQVLIPAGAPITAGRLSKQGFEVTEIETGEFLKSGGSVFCMRQEIRESI
ncbi:MAG: arginine deiminase-related protein [Planctomycetota bacterium]|nr:arginine deiminase-related protein [Planctomycetota bacterium]